MRWLTVLGLVALIFAGQREGFAFQQASPGREFTFPKDHGKHPEFETEWWYFTGNLDSQANARWGFQLTFFRRGLLQKPATQSVWAVTDLYPAHFALVDIDGGRFFHTDLISREGPGLAGASSDDLNVQVRNWRAKRNRDVIQISAHEGNYGIDLNLVPLKEPVIHGKSGLSRKGDSETQASHYYSFTRLKTEGTLVFDNKMHKISGYAWMDHEFASGFLLPDQAGWDWFSFQLDEGTDIMVFHLRKKDGRTERPFGTIVPKSGPAIELEGKEISIESVGSWTSPHTKAVYPSGWKISIPEQQIELEVKPLLMDQELFGAESTGIIYWEGAVAVTGTCRGKPVTGRGYAELSGYAHPLGGRL